MANFLKGLINSLKLPDEDDDYDEYIEEEERKDRERTAKKDKGSVQSSSKAERSWAQSSNVSPFESEAPRPVSQKVHSSSNYNSSTYVESRGSGKAIRMERPEGSKVIPIRTTQKGLEVCIMKPKSFEDSQDICDVLLSGRAAVVNLEGFDIDLAQRIMDFISGAVYSMNGKLYQISGFIFIVSPESVDISGDYSDILAQSGFEVPTLSKDF